MPAFRSVSVMGDLGQTASGFMASTPVPAGGWGTTATGLLQTSVNLLNAEQQARIAKEQRKTAEAQARAAAAAAARPTQAGAFSLPFGLSPLTAILGVVVVGGIAWAVSRRS